MTKKSYSVATPSFLPSEKQYTLRTRLSSIKKKAYSIKLNKLDPFRDNISQYPVKLPANSRYSGVVDPDVSVFAENIKSVSAVLSDSVLGSIMEKEKGATIEDLYDYERVTSESVSNLIDLVVFDRINEKTITLEETQNTIRRASEAILELIDSVESLRVDTRSIDILTQFLGVTNTHVPVTLIEPSKFISEMQYEATFDPNYEIASRLLSVIHGKSFSNYYQAVRRKKEIEVRYMSYEVIEVILNVLSAVILEYDLFDMDARPTYIPELFTATKKSNYESTVQLAETANFFFTEIQTIDDNIQFFERKIDNYGVSPVSETELVNRAQVIPVLSQQTYDEFNYVEKVVDLQEHEFEMFDLVQEIIELKFYENTEAIKQSPSYESKIDAEFVSGIFVSRGADVSYLESDVFTRLYTDKEVTITNDSLSIDRVNEKKADILNVTEFIRLQENNASIEESLISEILNADVEAVMNEFTGSAATARSTYLHEYEGFSYTQREVDALTKFIEEGHVNLSEYVMTISDIEVSSLVDKGHYETLIFESNSFARIYDDFDLVLDTLDIVTRQDSKTTYAVLADYPSSVRNNGARVIDLVDYEDFVKFSSYQTILEEYSIADLRNTRQANLEDDFGDEVTRRDVFQTSLLTNDEFMYFRPEFDLAVSGTVYSDLLRKEHLLKVSDVVSGNMQNEVDIQVETYLDVNRQNDPRMSIITNSELFERVLFENYSTYEEFTGSSSTGKPTYVQEYDQFGIVAYDHEVTLEEYQEIKRNQENEYFVSIQENGEFTLTSNEFNANVIDSEHGAVIKDLYADLDETLRTTLVKEHDIRLEQIDLMSRINEVKSEVIDSSLFDRANNELISTIPDYDTALRDMNNESVIDVYTDWERVHSEYVTSLVDNLQGYRKNEVDIVTMEFENSKMATDTYLSELVVPWEFTRDRVINSSFVLETINSQRDVVYNTIIEEFNDAFGPDPKEYTWLWHSRPNWWSSWNWRVTK